MRPTLIEIEDKAREIWAVDRLERTEVEVREFRDRPGIIHITVQAMYESPGRSLPKLIEFGKFLGTNEIEDVDQFGYGGCESCDYGSRYGFTLEVKLPE